MLAFLMYRKGNRNLRKFKTKLPKADTANERQRWGFKPGDAASKAGVFDQTKLFEISFLTQI